MIRHLVFVRFKSSISSETRDEIMRDLASVVAALPGCGGFQVLTNNSPETEMTKGYAHGFAVDFDDEAARAAYLTDPSHQAVGARIVAAAEGGADGVIVFDHARPS